MSDKVVVKMIRPYGLLNAGETGGYAAEVAEKLIGAGIAVKADALPPTPASEPEPAPVQPSSDPGDEEDEQDETD